MPVAAPTARLPLLTLVALFVGYACSYFHRADLAALAPLWANDPASASLRAALPDIASLGMLVYACGKVLGGFVVERLGGRRTFVGALVAAGLGEYLAMHAATPAAFAACRVGGMLCLGCAWPAVGHVTAAVTPRERLGTVMAFLSLSYLAGDAAVRALFAAVVANGGGAKAVFGSATGGLLGGAAVVGVVLATVRGEAVPRPPLPVLAAGGEERVLRPMLVLAAMNCALAMVREALLLWTPTLLVEQCGAAADDAVRASALLPIASACTVLLGGRLADRGPRVLLLVMLVPALVGASVLAVLAAVRLELVAMMAALATASAFVAVPMTLASGVLPLRASRAGSARWLGIVDGAGSLGAVFAGGALARVQAAGGVSALFAVLAAVAFAAAALAVAVHRVSAGRT